MTAIPLVGRLAHSYAARHRLHRTGRGLLALAGVLFASCLLVGPTSGPAEQVVGSPVPAAPPNAGIVVDQADGVTSATVYELMPGVDGRLDLVGASGVVASAPLGAGTAQVTAPAAGSYRLHFSQQAASEGDGVSISGAAIVASPPFTLSAGDVVVAVIGAR